MRKLGNISTTVLVLEHVQTYIDMVMIIMQLNNMAWEIPNHLEGLALFLHMVITLGKEHGLFGCAACQRCKKGLRQ